MRLRSSGYEPTRSKVALLALALAVVSLGGACEDDNPTPATARDCEPIRTVEVMGTWSGNEQIGFQKVLDQFELSSGIDVRYTSVGRDIDSTLDIELISSNPPDVAILSQPALLQKLAGERRLLSIPDLKEEVRNNFGPDWVDLGSHENTFYGVWFKANNKSTIWFDTTASPEARAYPSSLKTWDLLIKESERLATAGQPAFSIAGGVTDAWLLTDWFENVYLRTAGLEAYKKLSKHETPWNHHTVRTALEFLAQIFNKPGLVADGVLSTGYPDSVHQVFQKPAKARMVYAGDFLTAMIPPDAIGDAGFFDFPDFQNLPGEGERSVIVGGNVAVLPRPGSNQKENCGAKKLMRALTTAETVEPWAKVAGGFSSANSFVVPKLPTQAVKNSAEGLKRRIVFDLSDQQPLSFGGTPGMGMYAILRDFVADPNNVEGTMERLEKERRVS